MDFKLIDKLKLYPLVPLSNYSKYPKVRWGDKKNWIKNIEGLEELRNYTGLSMICGEPSGIMVIDVDRNHGDGSVDGQKSLIELLKSMPDGKAIMEEIKKTLVVNTPSGGVHMYFKYKEGLKSKANYVPGIDIRTDGGLIVVPTSKVRVDKEVRDYTANSNDIQEMPQALFDKLKELIKFADGGIPKETELKKYYQKVKEGEGRNQALTSWLGHMIERNPNMRDSKNLLPQAIMYNRAWFNPPLADEEVSSTVQSVLSYATPKYLYEGGKINIWALVQHIIKEQPCYTKGNLWFIYDNEHGVYRYLERGEVQRIFFKYPPLDREKTAENSKKFADLLMLTSENASKVQDEKRYINCLNGVIDIETDELLPHDPQYKLEVQFQANYYKEWKADYEKSEFKRFIKDLLGEGSIETVQEAIGLMLSPHAKEVQNCFIYKGEGSNGKSALFDIQEALIEDKRCICGIGLGDFGGDFTISMAEGKHVNIVRDDELSGKTINKAFKSMVCGEPVMVNRKGKDIIRMGFNMTMFFGLNRMPFAEDKSTGFFRRPVIIPFNTSFGTDKEVERGLRDKVKDPEIADRIIKNELDIVFMWAYEGLKRVKANKWKATISDEAEQEMEEYREEVDSTYAFFREMLKVVDPTKNRKLPIDTVYIQYKNWASYNDITPMGKTQFGRQLKSYGVKSMKSGSTRYYVDIEIVEPM